MTNLEAQTILPQIFDLLYKMLLKKWANIYSPLNGGEWWWVIFIPSDRIRAQLKKKQIPSTSSYPSYKLSTTTTP